MQWIQTQEAILYTYQSGVQLEPNCHEHADNDVVDKKSVHLYHNVRVYLGILVGGILHDFTTALANDHKYEVILNRRLDVTSGSWFWNGLLLVPTAEVCSD